eukprot:COSAG01_NODE_52330_length_347_cov_0.870968_1_plen_20_part_10
MDTGMTAAAARKKPMGRPTL